MEMVPDTMPSDIDAPITAALNMHKHVIKYQLFVLMGRGYYQQMVHAIWRDLPNVLPVPKMAPIGANVVAVNSVSIW